MAQGYRGAIMAKKKQEFEYPFKLVLYHLENAEREAITKRAFEIPYLLYEMEKLSDGTKIVVSKPAGKKEFGRFAKNDLMVFVCNEQEKTLWLISHGELRNDIRHKFESDREITNLLIEALLQVCNGEEPSVILERNPRIRNLGGLSPELILNAYKWIWIQEDCNYPNGEGRWKSMKEIKKVCC